MKALRRSACRERIRPGEDYVLLQKVEMTATSQSVAVTHYHLRHDATPRRRAEKDPEKWRMYVKKAEIPDGEEQI